MTVELIVQKFIIKHDNSNKFEENQITHHFMHIKWWVEICVMKQNCESKQKYIPDNIKYAILHVLIIFSKYFIKTKF